MLIFFAVSILFIPLIELFFSTMLVNLSFFLFSLFAKYTDGIQRGLWGRVEPVGSGDEASHCSLILESECGGNKLAVVKNTVGKTRNSNLEGRTVKSAWSTCAEPNNNIYTRGLACDCVSEIHFF